MELLHLQILEKHRKHPEDIRNGDLNHKLTGAPKRWCHCLITRSRWWEYGPDDIGIVINLNTILVTIRCQLLKSLGGFSPCKEASLSFPQKSSFFRVFEMVELEPFGMLVSFRVQKYLWRQPDPPVCLENGGCIVLDGKTRGSVYSVFLLLAQKYPHGN